MRTVRALPDNALSALHLGPETTVVRPDTVLAQVTSMEIALVEVARWATAEGIEIAEVSLADHDLEDAFLRLIHEERER